MKRHGSSEVVRKRELRNARSGAVLTSDGSEGAAAYRSVRVVENNVVQDVKILGLEL
jgi:hypothetical protein